MVCDAQVPVASHPTPRKTGHIKVVLSVGVGVRAVVAGRRIVVAVVVVVAASRLAAGEGEGYLAGQDRGATELWESTNRHPLTASPGGAGGRAAGRPGRSEVSGGCPTWGDASPMVGARPAKEGPGIPAHLTLRGRARCGPAAVGTNARRPRPDGGLQAW